MVLVKEWYEYYVHVNVHISVILYAHMRELRLTPNQVLHITSDMQGLKGLPLVITSDMQGLVWGEPELMHVYIWLRYDIYMESVW